MRRSELRRNAPTVPALGTAVLLALCSCGQALRTAQPASARQTLVDNAAKSADRNDTSKHKNAFGEAGSGTDTAKPIWPGLGSAAPPAAGDPGALQAITSKQMLDHAFLRYETARRHWEQGQLTQAREETDFAFRTLMLVPSELVPEQAKLRDELQLLLSRLVVTMSVAHAGPIEGLSELPLVLNSYVEREIRGFQTSERHFFVDSFRRSGKFMPRILQRLEEEHMPAELAWLPLIESGFTVRALSPARALGLWQFIPSTGYRFGLRRDVWVDERMDPERATDAALAYLKQLHGLFGDWSTAVAAYNCGEANVARAIGRQRVEYLDSFWDLFPLLPYETARYVPRFHATLQIIKDPVKFGFTELEPVMTPLAYDKVMLDKQTDLAKVARMLDVDVNDLRELNPALRQKVTPPGAFELRVPQGQGPMLLTKLTQPQAVEEPATTERVSFKEDGPVAPTRYRVRRGDTLYAIAARFRVSVNSLVRANSLSPPHRLSVGQVLSIPRRGV